MNYIFVINCNNHLTENQRASFLDTARRWQCNYKEVSEKVSEPRELKFRAFEFCPDADKILILDADTLIRSDTPSIFKYNNAAVLSSQNNLADSTYADLELIHHIYPRLFIPKPINSGVLLLSKENKKVLEFAQKVHQDVSGRVGIDQAPINYALVHFGIELQLLDHIWNFRGPIFPEPMHSFIYHFAGQGERYQKLGNINWFYSPIEDRNQLPQLLTQFNRGAEVGVHRGLFSEVILRNWPGHLYLVDLWEHQSPEIYQSMTCNQPNEVQQKIYLEMMERLRYYQGRTTIIRKDSVRATKEIKSLDFVYIDANHSFEATLADIQAYYPLIKSNGLIAGHDFLNGMIGGCDFGVKRAVFEFLKDLPFTLFVTHEEFPTWYFYKEKYEN